jgi:hypothetical protein
MRETPLPELPYHRCVRKQNVILTAWLSAPILAVVLLCYWIIVSLQTGPKMHEPAVGAGHGQTGGANAIGELLSARRAKARLTLVIDDRTGLASADYPLLIGLETNAWTGEPMTPAGDGRWTWDGQAGMAKQGFEVFWRDQSGVEHRDKDGRRHLTISSGEQVVTLTSLDP